MAAIRRWVLGSTGRVPRSLVRWSGWRSTAPVALQVQGAIHDAVRADASDPYDTHPPLSDRLAALGAEMLDPVPDGGPRAITLFEGVDDLEADLLGYVHGTRQAALSAIAWPDAGPRVWGAIWRDRVRAARSRLTGLTPASIPELVTDLPATAVRLGLAPDPHSAGDETATEVVRLLGASLAVTLLNHGWTVSALPGETVVLSHDGRSLAPFAELARLIRREETAGAWRARWIDAGLLDADLGAPG
jgi:heat shock protein HtpX